MERWRGRVALVTGASAGIGYSITKALAEKGMKVVACARNIAAIEKLGKELSKHPGSVTAVKCDVSKEEEVKAMFQKIRQDRSLGRVDVCINNAGLIHDASLLTGDPAQWRHMFDVNVLGLMTVTKEAFQLMQDNKIDDGHIILFSSSSGKSGSSGNTFHCYTATKAAISVITGGLRQELQAMKSNIRVSELCPGVVKTEVMKRVFGDAQGEALYSEHKEPRRHKRRQLYGTGPPEIHRASSLMCQQATSLLLAFNVLDSPAGSVPQSLGLYCMGTLKTHQCGIL